MSDLVERLRAHPCAGQPYLRREAADEIELLRENIRMRDDISRCQHKEIERLQAVVDALKEVHGWDTISRSVTAAVAALEDSDER
jgi:hypothetical protein